MPPKSFAERRREEEDARRKRDALPKLEIIAFSGDGAIQVSDATAPGIRVASFDGASLGKGSVADVVARFPELEEHPGRSCGLLLSGGTGNSAEDAALEVRGIRPFLDQQRGYSFSVNGYGVQADQLLGEPGQGDLLVTPALLELLDAAVGEVHARPVSTVSPRTPARRSWSR